MSKSIDQHTEVDKRIRDFVDRKSSPWYSFGQTIMERLVHSMPTRSIKGKDIRYEALQWKHTVSRQP